MGVTFGGEAIFGDGPATVMARGRALRHAVQEGVGGEGERVVGQGVRGRELEQRGELVADSMDELRAMVAGIEARLDGAVRELRDDVGRVWPAVVMTGFEPGQVVRLGVRWKAGYVVRYFQGSGDF